MGLRTMAVNVVDGIEQTAGILYDSTTMRALPWIFESAEDADAFCEWAHRGRGGRNVENFQHLSFYMQEVAFNEWRAKAVRREQELNAARAERDLRAVSPVSRDRNSARREGG